MNIELKEYIKTQLIQCVKRLEGYTRDFNGESYHARMVYSELEKYADSFHSGGTEPRIIIMPGLRGVGKTTLLAQLFLNHHLENSSKLYLSVDELVKRFDTNLWKVLEAYEEMIGTRVEDFQQPLFLFLDEIHCDKTWASFLKTIYDRSKMIFVFCTGSAALLLREQVNADLARRVFFVDIYPVSFTEHLLLKNNKTPLEIGTEIKEALLKSENANALFSKLKTQEKEINRYWLDIDKLAIDRYLKFGTFPFTLRSGNEAVDFEYVGQIISKIIYHDLPQFLNFETATLNKAEKILYLISDALSVSLNNLSSVVEMKVETLSALLKSLEKSSVLIRIPPYGSHNRQVRKPSKYLFASPALRFFFLSSRESTKLFDNYKGSLLEDLAGMYLNCILPKFGTCSLTYDVSENGADFIIGGMDKKIAIEIGYGRKGIEQVQNTLKRIKGTYGIVISESELAIKDDIVMIPKTFFLLM